MVRLVRRCGDWLLVGIVDDNQDSIVDGLDHARHYKGVTEKLLILGVASEGTVDLECLQEP